MGYNIQNPFLQEGSDQDSAKGTWYGVRGFLVCVWGGGGMKRWWFLFLHNRLVSKPLAQEAGDLVFPRFVKGVFNRDFCQSKPPDTTGNFSFQNRADAQILLLAHSF